MHAANLMYNRVCGELMLLHTMQTVNFSLISFSTQRQKILKKSSKWRDDWMEARGLTKYTNKEGIFHNIAYILHNHPYISSGDTLVSTISIFAATYVGMVV